VVVVIELQEFSADELRFVVGDDGIRNSKAVDDIYEEQHRLLRPNFGDRASFDLLGELIHGDEHMRVALGCPL
jgi:hypothetical protein